MKSRIIKAGSAMLSLAMLLPTLCVGALPVTALNESSGTQVEINAVDSSLIIENADSLANGVQAYYKDASKNYFYAENQKMYLEYNLREDGNMQVSSLNDKDGNPYFVNSLDAFAVVGGGYRNYASNSTIVPSPNLHRLGYYYYDMRVEGQNFISNYDVVDSKPIAFKVTEKNQLTFNHPTKNYIQTVYGQGSGEITNSSDPYMVFSKTGGGYSYTGKYDSIGFDGDKYQYIRLTIASDPDIRGGSFFYGIPGDKNSEGKDFDFTESLRVDFKLFGTGSDASQAVEYMIPMFTSPNFAGQIDALRLDFSGETGAKFNILKLEVVEVNQGTFPRGLVVNRDFLIYSDKLHSYTQFAATQDVQNVTEVGVELKIAKNTVDGFVVKADGTFYNNSLSVNDWSTAEYAGFIIKGAGVFGYILPADNSGGKLTIEDDGENYVITQSLNPENNQILHSKKKNEFAENEEYVPNGNDIFMGQRLYTDDESTFAKFLVEAENERNPIPAENFIVSEDSDGEYVGYDAIRGIYRFNINGYIGFNDPFYSAQNKQFKINFTIKGEENKDRNIWVMSYWHGGMLECAALLDENEMMIPVPLQVGKNFSESQGERNTFNLDDPTYSETIFPMDIKAGSTNEYTLLNLYQNWGQYPVKQISWIQYSAPYYHLSTGVTETNCIVPITVNGPSLPDFRGMSAPLWIDQPQHNNCGAHRFLKYTDADGKSVVSMNTTDSITSYGPTYAELDMDYMSSDGKIVATYTHMEMPQTDENRTYYTMKYTVLSDVTINDFKSNFQFYSVGSNDPTGLYQRVGYLNANNESAVVSAKAKGSTAQYVLGNECPYFSFFDMDGATSPHNQPNNKQKGYEDVEQSGYSNVGFLVYSSDFTIGGQKVNPNFVINDLGGTLSLSLDLGNVTLKAGDTFTINAIILPWGSQEMEGTYDEIQDKNVREVRENTLLDPVVVTPISDPFQSGAVVTAEKVESAFLPRVKTTNGKEAVFTVSGGENNQTIRVDGFKKLTDPKIYELIDGEWESYEVCSALTPDANSNGYSYDGYGVYYDSETKTYSYSFVTTMTGDKTRTFKVVAADDFDGWEITVADAQANKGMNILVDAHDINSASSQKTDFGSYKLIEDDGDFDYIRFTNNTSKKEGYFYAFANDDIDFVTGNYIVMKYRCIGTKSSRFEFYAASTTKSAGGSSYPVAASVIPETDDWQLLVIDIQAYARNATRVIYDENGCLSLKHLRADIFNESTSSETVDVAYIGISDSLTEIFDYDKSMTQANVYAGEKVCSVVKKSELVAAEITLGSLTIKNGDTFIVPVYVSNNSGASYIDLIPDYDKHKFTLVGVENGNLFDSVSVKGSHIILKDTQNATADGVLINLVFKPKVTLNEGSLHKFSVKISDANKINGVGFETSVTHGTLTVAMRDYGNVDGDPDGKITDRDVVILRRYLAEIDEGNGECSIEVSECADVNADGVIDSRDLILLTQYIVSYDYDVGSSNIILGPQK